MPDLLSIAEKVTSYLVDATATWDATNSHKFVVPTGKRWLLINVTCKQDANQTTAIYHLDASDVVMSQLATAAANTGYTSAPNLAASSGLCNGGPVILDAGEKIHISSGGAQGAAAYLYLEVLEWAVH